VPGAIPKDGPSARRDNDDRAGVTGRPVCGDVAMTSGITLSGKMLPITRA